MLVFCSFRVSLIRVITCCVHSRAASARPRLRITESSAVPCWRCPIAGEDAADRPPLRPPEFVAVIPPANRSF